MPARDRRLIRLGMLLLAALGSTAAFGPGALVTQVFALALVVLGIGLALGARR